MGNLIPPRDTCNDLPTCSASDLPDLPTSKITSGTFGVALIPNLDADKITTGTFDVARILDMDVDKITSGTFIVARIPDMDADKITSGTFNTARLPHLEIAQYASALLIDGSRPMEGTIDMAGHPIDNLPTPVSGSEAANKAYADASGGGGAGTAGMLDLYATLADHAFRGIFRSEQTVGQASGFGDVVYFKSDEKWYHTDADAEATTKGKLGIVLEPIASQGTGKIGELCDVRDDSWSFGVGSVVYVSCTSGSMTTTQPTGSGDQVRKVGVALAANKVAFKPDDTVIELV